MRKTIKVGLVLGAIAAAAIAGCGSSSDSSGGNTGGNSSNSATSSTTKASASHTAVQASTTGPTSGTGGSGGGSASGVGESCTQDSDCTGTSTDLTCVTADMNDPVFGGGPVNGYCTKKCSSSADCPSDASCLMGQSGSYCFENCTFGVSASMSMLDPDKCYGRADVRCQLLSDQTSAACVPSCGNDDQCPSGEYCDEQLTVCVAMPHTGDPIGAACDPTAMTDTCAGICVGFSATDMHVGLCSEECENGADPNESCGGLSNGLCAYTTQNMNGDLGTLGDVGFCINSCAKGSDCDTPLLECDSFANGGAFCIVPIPCKSDSDCGQQGAFPNEVCTQTAMGMECIDPTFQGAGGAGGAGGTGTTTSSSASSTASASSTTGTGMGGASSSSSTTAVASSVTAAVSSVVSAVSSGTGGADAGP